MKNMRAMVLTGHGGLNQLEYRQDWPKPVAGDEEVLIRVRACGLNNTDVNTRIGWYAMAPADGADAVKNAAWGGVALDFPRIQGADVVGVVEAVGKRVDRCVEQNLSARRVLVDPWLRDWADPHNLTKTGYFGSECDGGFAEYACVHHRNVHPIESDLCDAELATFATAALTAEHMLTAALVGEGDVVLISGASGGVGSALIQLCKTRRATSIALCAAAKSERVRALGAEVLAYSSRDDFDLATELHRQCGREQVSVVADLVGGEIWPSLIATIARGGRYVCAGAIAGARVDFDLRTFYLNNLTLVGATIAPPGLFAGVVKLIERGALQPTLAATYPLAQLREAQQAFIAKQHVGNIVVAV